MGDLPLIISAIAKTNNFNLLNAVEQQQTKER
jgi:hypothetical protein